ncbi:S-layer homology domain-containing protein [Calothrix sp. NIES-3974]|uniref:S-layer homology domain-containing protein n=1 Tax=Calothrix sp. NIES-3974 TaxID=2005462 RepID=UPI000B61CDD1|nr:S-layer homology domain-containing protein [Calothrix sp. NIES-3974]BAZ07757.1 S-layer domain-containing protein [Calothrix sp. NIES-3974]
MTNLPPSDPRSSSQRRSWDYDELIGILVAFAAIGGILFWVLGRRFPDWDWTRLPSTFNRPVPTAPAPDSTGANNLLPTPVVPTPTVTVPTPTTGTTAQPEEDKDTEIISSQPSLSTPVLPIVPPATPTDGNFLVTSPVDKMPTIPAPKEFTDVPDNFWASKFIDTLSSRNVIKGFNDNSFLPNKPVTRAEFASILQQAFDKAGTGKVLQFSDISGDFWAKGAINKSVGMGFLSGYPDSNFKPEQPIPRVQVIVALVSGLGNLKAPANPEQVISIYKDAKDIPNYAKEKVAIATTNGLVVNHPDPQAFAPNREATRAEVTAMIHQTLVRMGRLPAIESEYIVKPRR